MAAPVQLRKPAPGRSLADLSRPRQGVGRRDAHRETKRKASRFLGVHRRPSSRLPWTTQIVIPTGKVASFGSFRTEREAAEAYDRAVLYYRGPEARRNFPDRPLSPADEATLRAEVRNRAKVGMASQYRGVTKTGSLWLAKIKVRRRGITLGCWRTELEAAEAYDRAVLFFGGDRSRLNFSRRRLAALEPAELRRLAHAPIKAKASSRYRGVVFAPDFSARPWIAQIHGRKQTMRHLGTWAVEEDAARAYDRAARFYLGIRARLNFPGTKLRPADAQTLMREARRAAKATQSSRYVGVLWNKQHGRWQALIHHKYRGIHLGYYNDEAVAAEAYDEKCIELRGPRARINFDPASGEHVCGTRLGELSRSVTPVSSDRCRRDLQPSYEITPSSRPRRVI
jgi:hypothetical protein